MLFNKTKKLKVIEKTIKADSFFKRFKGLMFAEKPDYALVFELESEGVLNASIHMLFVFYPIDAVYLNKEKKVVDIKKDFKPFSLNYTPKTPSKYFIEFLAGTVGNKIELNDELEWS